VRKKKRTVRETETHRVITVGGQWIHSLCEGCGREGDMIRLETAAELLDIGVVELRQRLANSGGHFTHVGMCVWVCKAWLSQD
jgi:hypothetical protein